jgi:hypothetical protein
MDYQEVEHHSVGLHAYQRGAYALLSDHDSVNNAAFFVHGFWGDPDDTWMNFHWMIDSYSNRFSGWRQTDAYFLNYSSFSSSIDDASEGLLKLIKSFMLGFPDELLQVEKVLGTSLPPLPSLQLLLPPRKYKNIFLIGHSEGAVLIRRAIVLELKRSNNIAEQLLNAKLFLFAPAILGFTPSGLLGSALTISHLSRVVEPFLRLSPSYVEMKEGNSLAALKADTEKLQSQRPDLSCLRAHILFGSDERVVARGEFHGDYPEPPEHGKNHIDICKPKHSYMRPLDLVVIETVRAMND